MNRFRPQVCNLEDRVTPAAPLNVPTIGFAAAQAAIQQQTDTFNMIFANRAAIVASPTLLAQTSAMVQASLQTTIAAINNLVPLANAAAQLEALGAVDTDTQANGNLSAGNKATVRSIIANIGSPLLAPFGNAFANLDTQAGAAAATKAVNMNIFSGLNLLAGFSEFSGFLKQQLNG